MSRLVSAAVPNCTPRCSRCLAMGSVDAIDGLCDPCHTIRLLVVERDRAEAENARLRKALDWALDHVEESALQARDYPGVFAVERAAAEAVLQSAIYQPGRKQ